MQTELPKQFSNLFGSAAARANAPDPEPEVLADVVEESAQEDRVGEPVPDVRRTPTPPQTQEGAAAVPGAQETRRRHPDYVL